MEALVFPLIAALAGGFFLVRNIIHLTNKKKMMDYLETSPKAKLWVNKFGIEKTASLTKSIFLPLGCLVGLGLLVVGLRGLYIYLQYA